MNKYGYVFSDDEILEMGQILENLKSLSGHRIRAVQSYMAIHPICEAKEAIALMHTAIEIFWEELL
jgi:hypothetical protein